MPRYPSFRPGTVRVHAESWVEETRERIQIFEGVVIARKGARPENYTVRKISNGVGKLNSLSLTTLTC